MWIVEEENFMAIVSHNTDLMRDWSTNMDDKASN